MNIFNLQHYDVLDVDLGITDVRIKKTKTYGFNGTYLTEFKVRITKIISRISVFGIFLIKVEKILKGSLDLIPSPSPSVKIQIMSGKFA